MKNLLKNYRYWLLLLISCVAIIGTLGTPAEDLQPLTWLAVLIGSKIVGIGAGLLVLHLIKSWATSGKLSGIESLISD